MDNSVHGHLKQLLVDNLPDCALVLLDTDGKVLSWNVGAQGLLGYAEGEAVNITCLAAGGNPPPTVAWFKEPSTEPLSFPQFSQVQEQNNS